MELYLSVKIRSDDEIDSYTEEQFREEKKQMREVDGFTLVDYIKSSIEILMNMKIEDTNEGGGGVAKNNKNPYRNLRGDDDDDYDPIEEDDEMKAERKRRRKEKKEAKKIKKEEGKMIEGAAAVKKIKAIPKIDNHTPTSSIIDL